MLETEVIVKTDQVRVRIMTLEPRELAEWHYHTQVTDEIFCLTGDIRVRIKNPDQEVLLAPGQRCQIEKGKIHQLENRQDAPSTYLLVQALGKYDFQVVQP